MSRPVGPGRKRGAAGGVRKRKRPHPSVVKPPPNLPVRPGGTTRLETEPRLAQMLIENVRRTDSIPQAAQLLGITDRTVYEWLAMGQSDPPRAEIFQTFAQNMAKARAEFADDLIRSVKSGTISDPKLALEVLARRRPEWRQNTVQGTGQGAPAAPPEVKLTFIDESGNGTPGIPPPRPVFANDPNAPGAADEPEDEP